MFAVDAVAAAALNDTYPFEFAHTCVYGTPKNQNVNPSGIASELASLPSTSGTRVAPTSGVNAPLLAEKT
jgi:hypothetical protein